MDTAEDLLTYKSVVVGYEDWSPGLDDMLNWCYNNAHGKWAYGLHHGPPDGKLVCAFYFNDNQDYCIFSLTWGLT